MSYQYLINEKKHLKHHRWEALSRTRGQDIKKYPLLQLISCLLIGQYDPGEQNSSPLVLLSAHKFAPPSVRNLSQQRYNKERKQAFTEGTQTHSLSRVAVG